MTSDSTLYILNTPILTSYGKYNFREARLVEVRYLLHLSRGRFISAVGHDATAKFMSDVTGFDIPVNRVPVEMKPGDRAIVFRVLTRLPEGKVLGYEDLKTIPYEFGVLRMIK
jgi:hypothetical protein